MRSISLKVPEQLVRELETEARRRGISKSVLVRDAIVAKLRRGRAKKRVSCLDLIGELAGNSEGPVDGSTNPRHLQDTVVGDHGRGRENLC